VAISPADGYTVLVSTSAHAYGAAFALDLPYDPLEDFVPVAALTSQPYVLVAGSHAGFATLAELISVARAQPGSIRFGSTGTGTASHVGVEVLNRELGIDARHVPAHAEEGIVDTIHHILAGATDFRHGAHRDHAPAPPRGSTHRARRDDRAPLPRHPGRRHTQ